MNQERIFTGGVKEINISKEDRNRWENEDTEHTENFKKALSEWRNRKVNRLLNKIEIKLIDKKNHKIKKSTLLYNWLKKRIIEFKDYLVRFI